MILGAVFSITLTPIVGQISLYDKSHFFFFFDKGIEIILNVKLIQR